jgi:hypothetical protein
VAVRLLTLAASLDAYLSKLGPILGIEKQQVRRSAWPHHNRTMGGAMAGLGEGEKRQRGEHKGLGKIFIDSGQVEAAALRG